MRADRLEMVADLLEGTGIFRGRGVDPERFFVPSWMCPIKQIIEHQNLNERFPYEVSRLREKYNTLKPEDYAFTVDKSIKLNISGFDGRYVQVLRGGPASAGCAAGWAASMPEFNAQGLYLFQVLGYNGFVYSDICYGTRGWFSDTSYYALAKFFNISTMDAVDLFSASEDKRIDDPFEVAATIRKYISDHSRKVEQQFCRKNE